MNRNQFLRELERHLGTPEGSLRDSDKLSDIAAWDSSSAVLFIALADRLGATVSVKGITKSRTVSDLLSLVDAQLV